MWCARDVLDWDNHTSPSLFLFLLVDVVVVVVFVVVHWSFFCFLCDFVTRRMETTTSATNTTSTFLSRKSQLLN